MAIILLLTVELFRKVQLIPNYLATKRGLLPVLTKSGKGISKLLMAEQFFWMKLQSFHFLLRFAC